VPAVPAASSLKIVDDMQLFVTKWHETKYEAAARACGGDAHVSKYTVSNASIVENKARILRVCKTLAVPSALYQLIIAYAFIETETLSASQRDTTKDPSGANFMGTGAINYGCFNLNYALLKDVGMTDDVLKPASPRESVLNKDVEEGVAILIKCILKGVELWGIDRYVSYLRGGTTLFNDPRDYSADLGGGPFKVTVFKCGLNRICRMIQEDEKLYTDQNRVAVNIPWV
jgi:hypothetical protein